MKHKTRFTSTEPNVKPLLAAIVSRCAKPLQDRPPAMAMLVKGIVNWVNDNPTTEALLVDDLARMIERCQTREELADLAIQIRTLAFSFRPDASRVSPDEIASRVLEILDSIAFSEEAEGEDE